MLDDTRHGLVECFKRRIAFLGRSRRFDVILTADTNIKAQQNLSGRNIAILVLRAHNNRLVTHVEMLGSVRRQLLNIGPGEIIEVFQQ